LAAVTPSRLRETASDLSTDRSTRTLNVSYVPAACFNTSRTCGVADWKNARPGHSRLDTSFNQRQQADMTIYWIAIQHSLMYSPTQRTMQTVYCNNLTRLFLPAHFMLFWSILFFLSSSLRRYRTQPWSLKSHSLHPQHSFHSSPSSLRSLV